MPAERFDVADLTGCPEPVRRYLEHAIRPGCPLAPGIRLRMTGRIKVGRWLEFEAVQDFRHRAFEWRARVGWRLAKPLDVVDRYAGAAGSTEGRFLGRLRFLDVTGDDTTRAAAGRLAAESIWTPFDLMPGRGARWRVDGESSITASRDVEPERCDVTLAINSDGAVSSVSILRWGIAGQASYGYIPFGGDIHAERTFGDLTLPSRVTVGWWFGTPRYEPFFEADVVHAERIV